MVAAKGLDFEDNVVEIAQENQILADNGVTLGRAAAPAPSAGAAPMDPDDNNETDPTDSQAEPATARKTA